MPFEKGNQIGKKFKPGVSGNPEGRPKKIYTILKETGYSADDIRTAQNEISWYTEKDLRAAANKKTNPAIVRILAKRFLSAIREGDYKSIKEIIDHIIGRAAQSVDLQSGGEPLQIPNIIIGYPQENDSQAE